MFADIQLELEDQNNDGEAESLFISYDIDTNATAMDVKVVWVIERSSGGEVHNTTDLFNAPNATVDHRNQSWVSPEVETYTENIYLYDENDTLEAY